MDTYRVGSNIDAWCTKCHLVLAHTIEAIHEGKIKRVKCNTCQGKHQFKAKEPKSGAKSSKLQGNKEPKTKSKSSDFQKYMKGRDIKDAKVYKTSLHFVKNDLLNHPTFGIGIVVEEKDINKIEVLFESGPKLLVHAKA